MEPRPRVAVVFGGRSPEHSISCLTAAGVVAALDPQRYDHVLVGLTRTGEWVVGTDVVAMSRPGADGLPEVVVSRDHETSAAGQPPAALVEADVVLPLLHGAYGEDGTLQGLLEFADVRYVGSGVLASAVSMDKDVMKTLLVAAGVPVCRWVLTTAEEWASDPVAVTGRVAEVGWPVFVKPARAGSSFGISKVGGPGELPAAIALAAGIDPKVVVEEAVDGREVECGVLVGPDGGVQVSVLGEVVVGGDHDFYDFEAKYTDSDALDLVIPAPVDDSVVEQVSHLAPAAFAALCCDGLARVDFFLTRQGRVLLNEVNTMPGFTPSSMFPRLWQASGLDYPALVDRLLSTALSRPVGLR